MSVSTPYSFIVDGKNLEKYSPSDRPRKFLEAFAKILELSNYWAAIDAYVRVSAKCGRCSSDCQLHQATGEDQDIPCHRSEFLLKIYRRYFTHSGLLHARLFGGFTLTSDYLDEMAESVYRCTACRRCKEKCPMGIDHGLITHLSRWVLSEAGIIPKAMVAATREQLEGVGNTSAIPEAALKDTCEFLEEDFEEDYEAKIEFPFDVEEAEYVFFPAVSDYLLEPDTLMGNALVFAFTGDTWTIGTKNFDGINYGLFCSDRWMESICNNIVAEVKRLKGKKILIGECGHATRSAWMIANFAGKEAPPVVHCMQYLYAKIKEGKIPLKGKVIEERVTYHDPCNIARSGKITEEPREILKMICQDFVDMAPNRKENYCCGGGGGTVSLDEIREFRTQKMGKSKADQIRATGAKIVVSPCANCKKQLSEVCEDNGLEGVKISGLHDLLLRATDLEELKKRLAAADAGAESPE